MFKPINNNVILLPKEEKNTSKILFENNNTNNNIGIVVAKDEEIKNVNINDIIIFKQNNSYIFEYNDVKYISINYNDIISIIE